MQTIRVLFVVLAVAVAYASAQSYQKGGRTAINMFGHHYGDGGMNPKVSRNKFRYDVYPAGNATLYAGQEARIRVATTIIRLEDLQNVVLRNAPRAGLTAPRGGLHAHFPLSGMWILDLTKRNFNISTLFPAFNVSGPSGVRVRVVPAFSSRTAATGAEVQCGVQNDVWQEKWGMTGRALAWGREMAFSGYVTFTVPPFPFKACIKDTSDKNATRDGMTRGTDTESNNWMEFDQGAMIHYVRDPLYVWQAPSALQVGDFAAIRVGATARHESAMYNRRFFDPTEFSIGTNSLFGDKMKFVPAGFPCTYDKASAGSDLHNNVKFFLRDTTNAGHARAQYCGTNAISATNFGFLHETCVLEGAIAGGVFRTGTNARNPFATFATLTPRMRVPTEEALVGYVQLPAAGDYDICFSPEAYRRAVINVTIMPKNDALVNPVPVWFKLYKDSSCLGAVGVVQTNRFSSCASRVTMLTTTAVTNAVTWTAMDTTPGSWGTIRIAGSGLNSAMATKWDYSAAREFYEPAGGDQFRIVPVSAFTGTAPITKFGDLYFGANGARLQVTLQVKESGTGAYDTRPRIRSTYTTGSAQTESGQYRLDQYFLGLPQEGTYGANAGCWSHAWDNFGDADKGLFGNPGTQCCTKDSGATLCAASTCSRSDQFDLGPTASGDLGGNPRSGYSSWTLSSSSATEVWAYVRFPKSGRYQVCYRQAGLTSWRVIRIGAAPGGAGLRPMAADFAPAADFTQVNFTYSMNDTSANTWGALHVISTTRNLNTLQSNYYDVSMPAVVGSGLKLVERTQSCYVDMGTAAGASWHPGMPECSFGRCGGSESCANCRGSSDDDATLRHTVAFFVKVPNTVGKHYRVCFKNGAMNWNMLMNPRFPNHLNKLDAWHLSPLPAPSITYELHDMREGTLGKFIIRRGNSVTHPLNLVPNSPIGDGDVFRLVVNETSVGKEVFCDAVWGAPSTAGEASVLQNFVAAQSSWNLGLQCASGSPLTTACAATATNPSSSGISGRVPYTDINSMDNTRIVPYADGAVAFVPLPPAFIGTRPVGYKVCYKQHTFNWFEATPLVNNGQFSYLSIARRPVYTVSVSHYASLLAGSYGYIAITGTAASPVTRATDIIKLVPDAAGNCDREAAGTQSLGNNYISLAGSSANTRAGAAIVGGTDADTITATLAATYAAARAYMVFPSVLGRAVRTTAYKVCFMTRATAATTTANWMLLATVNVVSNGVVYTGQSRPVLGGVLSLKFLGNAATPLNTQAGGDSAKLVDSTSPCFGGADVVPNGVTSTHVGLELASENSTVRTNGNNDLGPSNDALTPFSTLRTTLPYSGTYFKVCYRVGMGAWFEVEQAPAGDLEYGLGADGVLAAASGVGTFTINAQILGQYPGDVTQTNYASGVPYASVVLGGVSSVRTASSVTTPYFTVAMASGVLSTTMDRWKLVQAAVETPAGVWTAVPMADCASPSAMTGFATVASGTAQADIYLNFPSDGRWFVCYQRGGSDVWLRVNPASAAVANPITVVANQMRFTADLTAASLSVVDRWTFNTVQQGGLSNNDTVYMVNRSDVCGMAASYNRFALTVAALPLNQTATNTVQAVRSVGQTVWWLSAGNLTGFNGWYKVCVFRSQETQVNNTDATTLTPKPFVRSNWYQIDNQGSSATGGGSPFFVNSQPAKLVLDACPPFNMTRRMRAGRTVDVTVYTADANNNRMDFSVGTFAYEVVAGSADATRALPLQNTGGSCASAQAPLYGWASTNLRQYTESGKVTFRLAAIGACPSGGCQLQFSTSAAGISSTQTCTFDVIPTVVARLQTVSGPATCRLGQLCTVRVAAYDAENSLAFTATNAVTVTPTNFAGIGIRMNNAVGLSGAAAGGNLANGFVEATFEFSASSGALFAADTAVTLSFSANGRNASHVVTVLRPVMTAVHIVDLYPDASVLKGITQVRPEANPDFFVRSAMVPKWEPTSTTGFWRGGRTMNDGVSAVTAAAGYHLVAQQFYTVILRPVSTAGGVAEYLSAATLIDSTRSISIVTDALTAAGNAVIGSCADESCTAPFTTVSFANVKQAVTFRLRNQKGCERSRGGCTLQFQFGGVNLGGATSITTPVRSIAVSLGGECWADDGVVGFDSGALTSGAASCGSVRSTVENGWMLRVTARDQVGDVDEYFEGNVLAVLRDGNGMMSSSGLNLTTVGALAGGAGASLLTSRASMGVAMLQTVTVSRPCSSGCEIQVLSDWGANILEMGGLVAQASTRRLRCTLSGLSGGVLGKYDPVAQRTISGPFAYDATTAGNNVGTMIYEDTPICVNVEAVNANNVRTLYETNWVLYFAEGGAVTITDTNNNVDRRRYRPLTRSAATFCFTVSYSATAATIESRTFSLRFIAQRFNDAGYWAGGANGECMMGTFTVFKKKNIAALRVTRAEGMNAITTLPAGALTVAAQRQSATAATALKVEFGVFDHYGRAIASNAIVETGYGVVIRACRGTTTGGLDATCQTGTTGSADGSPVVVSTRDDAEAGVVTVNVAAGTTAPLGQTAAPSYSLTFDKYCIGCVLTFDVRRGTDLLTTKLISDGSLVGAISATVNVNILIQQDTNVGRRLAYVKGSSPLRGNFWQNWASGSTTATTGTVLFSTACFDTTSAAATTACYAKETIGLQQGACDPRGATTIEAGASNAPVRMYVVVTEAAATVLDKDNAEPICGTSGVSAPCTTAANIGMQVDILNSYSVAVSIGNQLLSCVGVACSGERTATVSQTLAARGTTVVDAITRMGTSAFAWTSFRLQGVNPSNFYATDASGNVKMIPSINGKFAATATTNASSITVTGITSANNFVWRGPQLVKSFVVRDTTAEVACTGGATYACHSTSDACVYNGYPQTAGLDAIAFPYSRGTTTIPVGVAFPITVDVRDAAARRVWTAAGTVTVAVASWVGCNNGGTMTVVGSGSRQVQIENGRASVWVSFSAPCQGCVLSFTLTPSTTQRDLYADLLNNPGGLVAMSNVIEVRGGVMGTHVVVTNPVTEVRQTLTVADTVSLSLQAIGSVGRLAVNDAAASVSVTAYNTINGSTTANWWWVGNGGILRSSRSASLTDRHGAMSTFAGSGTLAFLFTRTCASCSVTVAYTVGMSSGSFVVRNNGASSNTMFMVVTSQSQQMLVGYRPRRAMRGRDFAVAVWHTGSELAAEAANPIAFAGVAATAGASLAAISKTVANDTNGDGGAVRTMGWMTDRAEAHRVQLVAPCDKCTLRIGTDSMGIHVFTMATHLRFDVAGASAVHLTESFPMTTRYFAFTLLAADNDGFVDRWFGGYGFDCAFSLPFSCPTGVSAAVSAVLSANGASAGGFLPSGIIGFQSADTDATKLSGTFLPGASVIADGRGSVQVAFGSPVNIAMPLFSSAFGGNAITSARPAGLNLPVPTVSINPSNNQLVLAADARTSALANAPLVVTVGLVRSVDSTQALYVVGTADNLVTASFGTGCPAIVAAASRTSVRLVNGIATLSLTFAAATAANTQCAITLAAGAGSGVCSTCTRVISVTVSAVAASRWVWLRPTTMDNGGNLAAGPYFGAAGRRTFFQVAARGVNPLDTTSDVSVACDGCTLELDFSACGTNAPTSTPVTATFGADGTASVSVTWRATPASYTCGYKATVKTSTNVALTGEPTNAAGTVSICTPARVVMVTNVTSTWGGRVLRTGLPYTFHARIVDASGAHCPGDSQDDATTLTIEAMTSERVPRTSDRVRVVNVMLRDTTTAGLAAAASAAASAAAAAPLDAFNDPMPWAARNSVRSVFGGFNFSVVFSNSTTVAGGSPVRVRVVAASATPVIAGANAEALSGGVDTMIAATMLRFSPMAVLPRHAVANWAMMPAEYTVQAVDAVDPSWVALGLVPAAPNVAARMTEPGNAAEVRWIVEPTVAGTFPITFATGASTTRLVAGEARFSGLRWMSATEGTFSLSVAPQGALDSAIRATRPYRVTVQALSRILINTTNFAPTAAAFCSSDCLLPNTTFAALIDNVTQAAFLNTSALRATNVSVFVADVNNMPIIADSQSVLMADIDVATSRATLAMPEAYTTRAPLYSRVSMGVARFFIGFLGSTEIFSGSGNHTRIRVRFTCPRTRPAALRMAGEAEENPCFARLQNAVAQTRPIQIGATGAPAQAFTSAAAQEAAPIIKIGTNVPSIAVFNVSEFARALANGLNGNGFPFINAENAASVIQVVACDTQAAFGNADLGTSVCGPRGLCASPGVNCPNFVTQCLCPNTAARALLLNRFLLQSGTKVQVEVQFKLDRAVGFTGTNERDIITAFTSLGETATRLLKTDPALVTAFAIDVTRVAGVSSSAPAVTASLAPTPVVPVPRATTAVPAPAAASAVQVVLALLVATLLALM